MSKTPHSRASEQQLNYLRDVIRTKGPNRFPTLEEWADMYEILHVLRPKRLPQKWQKVAGLFYKINSY